MILKPNQKAIEKAVRCLRTGGSMVYPTDTAYGLGVDALNSRAVARLYRLKGRNFAKPVHVVVTSLQMAKQYVFFDEQSTALFRHFLPGPLSLVLPLKPKIPASVRKLSAGSGRLGIRMPKNKIALSLVRKLGRPITATSANFAGGRTPYSIAETLKEFQTKIRQPDLYLDAGRLPKRRPSTLVEIRHGKIRILRKGPLSKKLILKALHNA